MRIRLKKQHKHLYPWRGWWVALCGLVAFITGSECGSMLWLLGIIPALALRVWARQYIGDHSRGSQFAAPELVMAGPYAWIRHPLYVSNLLLSLSLIGFWKGFTLWAWAPAGVLVMIYVILTMQEDAFLEQQWGFAWQQWRQQVKGRWIPRGHARGNSPPLRTLGAAIRNDLWTWVWCSAAVILLVWARNGLCSTL